MRPARRRHRTTGTGGRRRQVRRGAGALVAVAACTLLAAGCAVASGGSGGAGPGEAAASGLPLPPAGHGTLLLDQVSISMRTGSLQVKVTPLMEEVLRATAPDTYRRLHGLAETHGDRAAREAGIADPDLFLVSFFSNRQGTTFAPEDLHLFSRGLRLRPAAVVPVTPGWGEHRLRQRETAMAVYVFGGEVDLESDLVVAYGPVESAAWNVIRPRVRAELERARARAGVGGG